MDEKFSLLLIDDDQVDRMAVRRTLRSVGLRVDLVEASDQAMALVALGERDFDCILLDYRLPGIDGLAVLRELRERGFFVPVVMLTGQGDELLAVEIMKAGAVDYLIKGTITPEQLAHSILNAVRVHRAEQAAAQALSDSISQLRLLAEASQQLASSLDSTTILDKLTALVVPALADWCAIDLWEADGSLDRVASFGEPEGVPVADLAAFWPREAGAAIGVPAALAAGRTLTYPTDLPDAADWRDRWQVTRQGEGLAIPLVVRERTIGGIILVLTHPSRSFDAASLVLAEEVAQRAAMALDNAHLFHQAQEAVRVRDEFLAVASHEFKNPLTTLLGNAQLLARRLARSESMTERDQRSITAIVSQAERLTRMVSSLLDVSRLQSGRFVLHRQRFALGDLLRRLVEEIAPTLEIHRLHYDAPPEPLFIGGDDLRLYEVFLNLVQNAIKYSPDGGVITIRGERDGSWAIVAVSDEGIGIPEESLPHLGRRYYRAPNAHEKRLDGVGLGLYVVNEIVGLHGGAIEIASREGAGSTFTIRLPLAQDAAGGQS